jgi:hypothetical protein
MWRMKGRMASIFIYSLQKRKSLNRCKSIRSARNYSFQSIQCMHYFPDLSSLNINHRIFLLSMILTCLDQRLLRPIIQKIRMGQDTHWHFYRPLKRKVSCIPNIHTGMARNISYMNSGMSSSIFPADLSSIHQEPSTSMCCLSCISHTLICSQSNSIFGLNLMSIRCKWRDILGKHLSLHRDWHNNSKDRAWISTDIWFEIRSWVADKRSIDFLWIQNRWNIRQSKVDKSRLMHQNMFGFLPNIVLDSWMKNLISNFDPGIPGSLNPSAPRFFGNYLGKSILHTIQLSGIKWNLEPHIESSQEF